MDEAKSAIISFILISITTVYMCISIMLFFWPKLLWSKKRVFDDPHQENGERPQKRETEFERLVGNGVKALECNVEVTDDEVYVIPTENKTVNKASRCNTGTEGGHPNDETKTNMLEERAPFEGVLENTEGKPMIIRVTEKDIIQLRKVIFHIKEKNRQDAMILGSDSMAVIHSLCKMGEYVPIYRKPDWKLYLLYCIGLLQMWPFEPSVLLISHRSVIGRLGKLVQRIFLIIHGPMFMHLRRRGIRTYIIDMSKDSYEVPGSVSLILVPDKFDLHLLTPRCNQIDSTSSNYKPGSPNFEISNVKESNPGHLTNTTANLPICTRTGIAKHECSNQNEEENVSEEGNPIQTIDECHQKNVDFGVTDVPINTNEEEKVSEEGNAIHTIDEGQVISFQKKKKKFPRTLLKKIDDFGATYVRSNTNEEEKVSEEGNPIHTIDEGQVPSFKKKKKKFPRILLKKNDDFGATNVRSNTNEEEKVSEESNAIHTIDEGQVISFQKKKKKFPRTLLKKIDDFGATYLRSNTNEEEKVSEEGNPIHTIDEGQVPSFQKKKKKFPRTLLKKIDDFGATNVRSNTNEEEKVSEESNPIHTIDEGQVPSFQKKKKKFPRILLKKKDDFGATNVRSNTNEMDNISEKGRADLRIDEDQPDEPNENTRPKIEISNENNGEPNLSGTYFSKATSLEKSASPPSYELSKTTESELRSEMSSQEFQRNSKLNFPI
ncbi:hypothetical protein ACF0H5_015292 [Mactra antiquata]